MGALDDLATFARIEVESRDVEPWADLLRHLYMEDGALSLEAALWLVALYNTYDSLGSACSVFARWPSPHELLTAADFPDSAQYECTQERRNLRGGLVLTRHASYGALVMGGDGTQAYWLGQGIPQPDVTTDCCDTGGAEAAWEPMTRHLRRVWGVGRQAAFEWAEFLAKVVARARDGACSASTATPTRTGRGWTRPPWSAGRGCSRRASTSRGRTSRRSSATST
jgi:hypothetical protein